MQTDKKVKITIKNPTTIQRIRFWNGVFGMTEKELEFLAAMIDGEGVLASTKNRAHAAASLGASFAVVNTYVKRLKDKRALIHEKESYKINNLLKHHDSVEVVIHRSA